MGIGKVIVWLIIGTLAGTLAGRLVTFSQAGFWRWTNIGTGMLGAVVGGCLFWLLGIDFGLADLKVTFEDVLSAFVGSLLCIVAWRLIRKRADNHHHVEQIGKRLVPHRHLVDVGLDALRH